MSDLRKPEFAPAAVRGTLEQRQRLRERVRELARDLAAGVVEKSAHELEALAQLCVDHFLPEEANRIRRWIPRAERGGGSPGSG